MKIRNLLITTAILLAIASMILSVGSILYVGDFSKDTEIADTNEARDKDSDKLPADTTPEATEPEDTEPEDTSYVVNLSGVMYGGGYVHVSTSGFLSTDFVALSEQGSSFENLTRIYVWVASEESASVCPYLTWEINSGSENVTLVEDLSYSYETHYKGAVFDITGDCDIRFYCNN